MQWVTGGQGKKQDTKFSSDFGGRRIILIFGVDFKTCNVLKLICSRQKHILAHYVLGLLFTI